MKKYAIGIMSGTSLDGIDISLVEIDGVKENTVINEVYSNTYSYPKETLKRIKEAINIKTSTSSLLCSLNVELSQVYSKCIFALLEEINISIKEISFIASHGQTIYHISNDSEYQKSSLQLGDGSYLANLTNTTVVSNFRQADIALGGEGAPLVPYADYILFRDKDKTRCMQNIGGIANVTVLPNGCSVDDVYAFDNGPGNMMIDYAMEELYNKPFDMNGDIALTGTVIKELLEEVLSLDFFEEKPPKSTGRELFGVEYIKTLLQKYKANKKEDIITTFTHITALSIAKSYEDFISVEHEIDEIIVSGGGARNKTLLSLIEEYTNNKNVFILDEFNVKSDYKEAIAFIILANETLNHNPSNIIKATGAKSRAILGQVSYVLK